MEERHDSTRSFLPQFGGSKISVKINHKYRYTNESEYFGKDIQEILMLTKRTKLIIGVSLVLGLLLCLLLYILGSIGIKMMTKTTDNTPDNSYEQLPRRKVNITIDTSQRQVFFDQLRKFADKYAFTILIDTRSSGPEDFLVYMTRGDIWIIGDNAFKPEEYRFGFYDANYGPPTAPESILDDLISDLQSFISEVSSATFTVEKP